MRNVPNLHPIPNQTGVPMHTHKVHLQFLDLKKRFNRFHNEHEKL